MSPPTLPRRTPAGSRLLAMDGMREQANGRARAGAAVAESHRGGDQAAERSSPRSRNWRASRPRSS